MLHQMHAGGINARFLRRLRPLPSPQTSVSSAPLSLWPLCSPYLSSVKRAIGNSVLSNAHAPQPCRYAVANAFRFRARTTEHIPFHSTCGIHSHTHVYCMRVYTGYSVEIDLFWSKHSTPLIYRGNVCIRKDMRYGMKLLANLEYRVRKTIATIFTDTKSLTEFYSA